MHIVLSVFCFLGIPGISILREVIVKGEPGDRGPEGKMGSVGPKGEPGDSSSINGKGSFQQGTLVTLQLQLTVFISMISNLKGGWATGGKN